MAQKQKAVQSDLPYRIKPVPGGESSDGYLKALQEKERVQVNVVSGVRTVLVVLSSVGLVYDVEALRTKILFVYPDAAVFFRNTSGLPYGVSSSEKVDLLIDLTGPRSTQGWFYARKLRRMARVCVGRNVGLFRKRIYDRLFDEKTEKVPEDLMDREFFVQTKVLELAGIPQVPIAGVTPDRSKSIALNLPPLAK